jgi:hypothetical protein
MSSSESSGPSFDQDMDADEFVEKHCRFFDEE